MQFTTAFATPRPYHARGTINTKHKMNRLNTENMTLHNRDQNSHQVYSPRSIRGPRSPLQGNFESDLVPLGMPRKGGGER